MSLTPAQKRAYARDIIQDLVASADFCEVYENEELEDASEQEWQDIYELILDAHVEVSWP